LGGVFVDPFEEMGQDNGVRVIMAEGISLVKAKNVDAADEAVISVPVWRALCTEQNN
jgi:hypothetical protein